MKFIKNLVCVCSTIFLLSICISFSILNVNAASNDFIPDVPENEGVNNAILNAQQLANVVIKPLVDLPQKNGNWSADEKKTGIPYSSSRIEEGFVPNFVSYYTFMTALKNPNSYLYTVDLKEVYNNSKGSTYYGTVCSAFCAYSLNIVPNYTTYQWQDIPGMKLIPEQNVDALKLGDTICHKTSGHVVMIIGITRNSLGQVGEVIVAEASGSKALIRKPYSAEEIAKKYSPDIYFYYRYSKINEVKYEPFETIDYNTEIIPRKGDKANWLSGVPVEIDLLNKKNYNTVEIYKDDFLFDTVSIQHGVENPIDRTVYGLGWKIGDLDLVGTENITTDFIPSLDIELTTSDSIKAKIAFYTEEKNIISITEEWLNGKVAIKDIAPENAKLCKITVKQNSDEEIADIDAILNEISVISTSDNNYMPLILQGGSVSSSTGEEVSRNNRCRTDFLVLQNIEIYGSDNLQYYVHYFDTKKNYLSNSRRWFSGSFNIMENAPTEAVYYRLVVKNKNDTDVLGSLVTYSYETTATILSGAVDGEVNVLTLNDLEYGSYKARMTNGTDYSKWCYWIVVDAKATANLTKNCKEVYVSFSASNAEPLFVKWSGGIDNGTKHITLLTDKEITEGKALCKYDCGNIDDGQNGQYKIRVAFKTEYGIIHTPLQEIITLKDHIFDNSCDEDCNNCYETRVTTHDFKFVTTKASIKQDGSEEEKCVLCNKVISKKTIKRVNTIKISNTQYTYDGYTKKPSIKVYNSSGEIISRKNYTVSYSGNCKNVGTYNVTVKMKGDYTGTKVQTFNINPQDISKCKIELSKTSFTYNGKVQKPNVTVRNSSGSKLTNTSYTVSFSRDCKNVGKYKITIKLKGNYTGSKVSTFKINPQDISKCKIKISKTSFTYNGNVQKPTVTVTNSSGKKLTKASYTLSYSGKCKYVGTYRIKIKLKGNYTGSKVLTIKINPRKTNITKITASKKSLKVSLAKRTAQVTGYVVQYSTSKKFTNPNYKITKSNKTTNLTLKNLKSKKKYYVRVRTYKIVNGKKYYSAWSDYRLKKTL